MLRRKLLLLLGSLIGVLVLGAASAIVVLHEVLDDISGASAAILDQTAHTTTVAATLTTIEAELNALRLDRAHPTATLLASADGLVREARALRPDEDAPPQAQLTMEALTAAVGTLRAGVIRLVTGPDGAGTSASIDGLLAEALAVRSVLVRLGRWSYGSHEARQAAVMTRFRWTVLGLGLAYLVVINVAIALLIRAAAIVLRPVDELLEATGRLAAEEFDYRAPVDRTDEFGELARATNALAERLQANEQRKLETLHQVARTLAHELNNAMAIIELQLELAERRAAADPTQVERLHEIHRTLGRMHTTVDRLKQVRRIVLTDYVAGVKMLDLERSIASEPAPDALVDAAPEVPVAVPRPTA